MKNTLTITMTIPVTSGSEWVRRRAGPDSTGLISPDANDPQAFRPNRTIRNLSRLVLLASTLLTCQLAAAAEAPVPLGSAATFAVLAGATVTSTGGTTVYGNLGSGPGTAVEGFPPGTVHGAIYAGGPTSAQAQADLSTAYIDAAGRNVAPVTVSGNLGGQTLPPGLYMSTSSLAISSGDLTLDAQGNTNAVFIFQMASTLTTTSGRQVILSGGARAANIYWQVGSSATLGTTTIFKGTIMAQISITLETGATLHGRALARIGAVTLDANTVTLPSLPEPPSFGPISRASDGNVTLVITNTPGLALTIQSSTNLNIWTTLATPTLTVSPETYIDTTVTAEARRSYRAFYP